MAEYNKQRYYWIKLTDRFMTSDTVDFLMGQKDGANYVVLYQMLCLKTVNNNGELSRTIGEVIIPYDEEKIQRDMKYFSIDTIRVAMNLYKRLGLIYEQDNGILKISNFENMIGSQTISAYKKQIQLQNKGGKKVENFPPDIDKDIDKEKEKSNREKKDDHAYAESEIIKEYNFSDKIRDRIYLWLQYKKEKNQGYTATGFKTLLNNLQKQISENGENYVLDSIDSSIANNYQGIYASNKQISSGNKNAKKSKIHFANERHYTEEELAATITDVDDIVI